LAVFLVLLIGLADVLTGPEIAFSIFYLVPIGFASWFGRKRLGLGVAVVSAAAWLGADLAAAAVYSHPAIPYWNCLVRLGIFLLVAHLLGAMRQLTTGLETAVEQKTALLVQEIESRKQLQNELLHEITKHEQEIVALLREANEQGRRLAKGLDPVVVELDGLSSALERLVKDTERLFGMSCLFRSDWNRVPVTSSVALQLYRMAQEAIHNAVKHSRAQCLSVELLHRDNRLRPIVTDDGEGFVATAKPTGGMGLRTLQRRAESIGATLRIDSQPGEGTEVGCALPLPAGEAYQLDHYYPERYLPTVLPACQTAQRIVVYCNGGDCEEGEFTALTLRSAGLPAERLGVYFGGMTEWATNGLPVELGARKSGNLRTAKP
jgi:glucose-6-phosphate-specific signal transduction histidine kinase